MLTTTNDKDSFVQKSIFWIVLLAVGYNALLAVVNGNVFSVNFKMAAGFEFLILLSAIGIIVKTEFSILDIKEISLIVFVVIIALLISIVNQYLFIDSIRNFLIIALFVMLGRRISAENLHKLFFVVSFIVFSFLLIEVFALDLYVHIFNPASYYANTRGVIASEFNDTGLFNTANAQQMSDRFGYGLFNGPRTSSIFLEQVSISNFMIILVIYGSVFWDALSNKKRVFFMALVLMILITARSRSALALTIFALASYHVLPLITRKFSIMILPAVLSIIFIVYFFMPQENIYSLEDSFRGRIFHTGLILASFNIPDYFSINIHKISNYADSGIPYVIMSYTLIGALVLWIYIATIVEFESPAHRRFIVLANLYFWMLLMVGAAVFTIKTAALLWILAGFLSVHSNNDKTRKGVKNENTSRC
jgi:putative polymerase